MSAKALAGDRPQLLQHEGRGDHGRSGVEDEAAAPPHGGAAAGHVAPLEDGDAVAPGRQAHRRCEAAEAAADHDRTGRGRGLFHGRGGWPRSAREGPGARRYGSKSSPPFAFFGAGAGAAAAAGAADLATPDAGALPAANAGPLLPPPRLARIADPSARLHRLHQVDDEARGGARRARGRVGGVGEDGLRGVQLEEDLLALRGRLLLERRGGLRPQIDALLLQLGGARRDGGEALAHLEGLRAASSIALSRASPSDPRSVRPLTARSLGSGAISRCRSTPFSRSFLAREPASSSACAEADEASIPSAFIRPACADCSSLVAESPSARTYFTAVKNSSNEEFPVAYASPCATCAGGAPQAAAVVAAAIRSAILSPCTATQPPRARSSTRPSTGTPWPRGPPRRR